MVETVVSTLEKGGYKFVISGNQIDVILPDNLFHDHNELLDKIRLNKQAVLNHLRYRGFTEVPPAAGDYHEATFDGTDEAAMKRWGTAARFGLIHLTDRVQISRRTGQTKVCFRCNQPLEWLRDDITSACKQEHNRVLERIRKGAEWLKAHADDPGYERAYDGFMALHEDLRLLYVAVGEPLDDPEAGYGEGAP